MCCAGPALRTGKKALGRVKEWQLLTRLLRQTKEDMQRGVSFFFSFFLGVLFVLYSLLLLLYR